MDRFADDVKGVRALEAGGVDERERPAGQTTGSRLVDEGVVCGGKRDDGAVPFDERAFEVEHASGGILVKVEEAALLTALNGIQIRIARGSRGASPIPPSGIRGPILARTPQEWSRAPYQPSTSIRSPSTLTQPTARVTPV